MFSKIRAVTVTAVLILFGLGSLAVVAQATHSWGGYHWARTTNPFTLQLGNNLSSLWVSYLATASTDWSISEVLDTVVVATKSNKSCRPTNGRVEVCNKKYGATGWLGVAQIWVNGNHIAQGVVKLNDTYFNTAKYNTSAWRQSVMCQEIGHTFGLGHQDENFANLNLGTCMDYSNDPARNDGAGDNLRPNQHDYEELAAIYTHLDSMTTVVQATDGGKGRFGVVDVSGEKAWGREIKKSSDGRPSLYERDLGEGEKVFTFVIWVD